MTWSPVPVADQACWPTRVRPVRIAHDNRDVLPIGKRALERAKTSEIRRGAFRPADLHTIGKSRLRVKNRERKCLATGWQDSGSKFACIEERVKLEVPP